MWLSLITVLLAAPPPEVALLCTQPDGELTELRFVRPGATELPAPVTRVRHLERATVLGALLPKSHTVLAVAQTVPSFDASWASSLFRLEPGKAPVVLADRVALSTRPLVFADGRVFVQRGTSGDGFNAITLDEIDPRSGKARTVHAFQGFTAFIAGAYQSELIVYRVAAGHADLVAVHRDVLSVRPLLAEMNPMARDFAVDERSHALFYTQSDALTGRWFIERLDLKSLERRRLVEGDEVAMLPTVLQPGQLAFAPGPGLGLRQAGGDALVLAPRGPGYERVRFVLGGLAIGLHEVPSELPVPFAVEVASGRSLGLPAPAAMRLDVAGVVQP